MCNLFGLVIIEFYVVKLMVCFVNYCKLKNIISIFCWILIRMYEIY